MMKFCALLLLVALGLTAVETPPGGTDERKQDARVQAWLATRPSRVAELRGAWIHRPFGLPGKSWDETIKTLADNGFNAIFVNMAWGYCADYESQVLPVHPDVAKRGDQIALCLEACRKYGVELHVWKVCWNMGHRTSKQLIEKMQQAGRTQKTATGKDTLYLAPHRLDNFDLEREALMEIVRKYEVDGIHLDYIRYPDAGCDFSDGAKAAFAAWLKQQGGKNQAIAHWPEDCQENGPLWRDFLTWRRHNINRLVKAVYEGAKRIRPEVAVSAAVYGSWDGAPLWIGQDAEAWMRHHWVDFVCPMDYTANDREFACWLKRQLPLVAETGIPLYVGIGAWKLKTPEAVARQMLLARQLGVDGVICFSLNPSFAQDVLPGLKTGVTSLSPGALLPHHSRSLHWQMPAGRPGLFGHLVENDSFTASVRFDSPEAAARVLATVEKDGVSQGGFGLTTSVRRDRKGGLLSCSMRRLRPGRYRILLKDENARLLHRSPVVSVLSPEGEQDVRLREGIPLFAQRKGIRVGVWVDNTYGGQPILQALQKVDEVNAAPLYNLKRESLDACQVVVLPQPRFLFIQLQSLATRDMLVEYVAKGGGLLVTHTMVGIRDYANLFYQSLKPISQPLKGYAWKVAPASQDNAALVAGLPLTPQKGTFPDAVGMELLSGGIPILQHPDGTCIAAAIKHGSGRYVACGLALGIGQDDQDATLPAPEQTFLRNAVLFLGGR